MHAVFATRKFALIGHTSLLCPRTFAASSLRSCWSAFATMSSSPLPGVPPTEDTVSALEKPMHVIICGAGPAGLLCAINLLRRNTNSKPRYTVELIDYGEDYGMLDDEGLVKKRSWMIGLAWVCASPLETAFHVGQVSVPISLSLPVLRTSHAQSALLWHAAWSTCHSPSAKALRGVRLEGRRRD